IVADTPDEVTDLCVQDKSFRYAFTLLSKPSGSASALGAAATSTATLTPDLVGAYLVQALVTDTAGNVSDARVFRVDAHACGSTPPGVGAILASPAGPDTGAPVLLSLAS